MSLCYSRNLKVQRIFIKNGVLIIKLIEMFMTEKYIHDMIIIYQVHSIMYFASQHEVTPSI